MAALSLHPYQTNVRPCVPSPSKSIHLTDFLLLKSASISPSSSLGRGGVDKIIGRGIRVRGTLRAKYGKVMLGRVLRTCSEQSTFLGDGLGKEGKNRIG
jgi:hypothetical protein